MAPRRSTGRPPENLPVRRACPDHCKDGWLPCAHRKREAHEVLRGPDKGHCAGPYPCPQCDGKGYVMVSQDKYDPRAR